MTTLHHIPPRTLAIGLSLAIAASAGRVEAATAFPLRVSTDRRYLVDQNGMPFFMIGDSAQTASINLTQSEFQSYIDTRVSQGFNTIYIEFITKIAGYHVPADINQNYPFTTQLGGGTYNSGSQTPDFTTPNDTYFAALEQKVAYAASKGVYVWLAMALADPHQYGWYNEIGANSIANCQSFGTYLANGHGSFGGFKKYSNVAWLWGMDWAYSSDTANEDRLHSIPEYIKAAGSTQPHSAAWLNYWLSTDQLGFKTYIDFNGVYSYLTSSIPPGTLSRTGYQYVPSSATGDGRSLSALPVYVLETGYENELHPNGTPAENRLQFWYTTLNGAIGGYWYGQRDIWGFARPDLGYSPCVYSGCTDWRTSISSTGAGDMGRISALLRSLPWQGLVPSGTTLPFIGRKLVPSGETSDGTGNPAAAQSADGGLLLVYVPSSGAGTQTITIDPRGMSGTSRARWWDPTAATFRDASPSSIANTTTQALTTPGANSAGQNDWLLVLDTTGSTTLTVAPASTTVAPRGNVTFTASGGSGTGYTWSLAVNASGGTIDTAGSYTAGSTGGVNDTVKVTDSLGNFATATVTVTAGVTIAPPAANVVPRGSVSFSASGGSGTGYIWSLSVNASGGSIDSAGAYTAGNTANVTDTVKVVDSLGNVAFAAVTVEVAPVVSIAPPSASVPPRGAKSFTASGGSGTGYAWSLVANASGGSVSAAGVYTAGTTGNVTDTVKVTDSLGNIATAQVAVGAGVAIAPTTASVAPGGTASFTASGGSGTGYVWSLAVNASGGSIDPSGVYTAGAKENVTDTVKATDSLGNFATAAVAVSILPPVTIAPADASVAPGGSVAFTASGGANTGWAWSLAVNDSGGSITAGGVYTAGLKGNTTDTVRVTDSLGHSASAAVTVGSQAGGVVKGGCSSGGAGAEWVFPLLVAAAERLRRRRT